MFLNADPARSLPKYLQYSTISSLIRHCLWYYLSEMASFPLLFIRIFNFVLSFFLLERLGSGMGRLATLYSIIKSIPVTSW